jgi:molecular chaperone HtpG
MAETYEFQAEIDQLMHLIVHAFYSKKEVFLRELLSNASDALNKLKYKLLTDNDDSTSISDLSIKIRADPEAKTLTIGDNGIGMTKEELVDILGTVAKSGTKEFITALKAEQKDENLIGKFGVGFYSAYLVSDNVEVYTRHHGSEETYRWQSNANGKFVVEKIDDCPLEHGTNIVLHIRDEDKEFFEENRLRETIKTHSNYIEFPINLYAKKTREVEEDANADVDEEKEEAGKIEEVDEEQEANEAKDKKTEEYFEYEQVNADKCIWLRSPKDVTTEEYEQFYKELSGGSGEYITYKHFRTEGTQEYSCLVYVPKMAPNDMFTDEKDSKSDVKLYARQVFITDHCEDLVPKWLRFLRGVVDSNDIQLNVSREMTQNSRLLANMGKYIAKKVLELFASVAEEDEDKYLEIFGQYANNLKLGVHEDDRNRKPLTALLRFFTANHKDKPISLAQYVSEMKENQKDIYYISGSKVQEVENSPMLDALRHRGYDVVFLVNNIDEYVVQKVTEFDEKKLVSITKEGLKLDVAEEKDEEDDKKYDHLFKFMKSSLGMKVTDVKRSHTLVSVPCAIVSSQYGMSANMERIVKAQTLGANNPMMDFMMGRKVLEVNVDHPLVQRLYEQYDEKDNVDELANLVNMLFETAVLTSGYALDDTQALVARVHKLVESGFDSGLFKDEAFKVDVEEDAMPPGLDMEDMEDAEDVEGVEHVHGEDCDHDHDHENAAVDALPVDENVDGDENVALEPVDELVEAVAHEPATLDEKLEQLSEEPISDEEDIEEVVNETANVVKETIDVEKTVTA